MRGSWKPVVALAFVGILLFEFGSVAALVDDFEDDDWLSFTHFHLGDRAFAGYGSNVARSGTRSYHVAIWGWTVRDFGSAYGYALFPTRKASVTELRVSLMYEALQDRTPSPWDAYAAGVNIDLLDGTYRNLGRARYVTAYQASRNAGRCAPTVSDLILPSPTALGAWTDLRRNPTADFPSAPWQAAEFVKVSIGFLCATGLTGASYSLYFDDFLLDAGARDTDGDGLADLEEEARIYAARVKSGVPVSDVRRGNATTIRIEAPPTAGVFAATAVDAVIDHPRADDLSVELAIPGPNGPRRQLLWDPGFHARGAAIHAPSDGSAVRGIVEVRGTAWRPDPIIQLDVDGQWIAGGSGDSNGKFELSWDSDAWAEGAHHVFVIAQAHEGGEFVARTSPEITVFVDRTPPDLTVTRPRTGETVSGLMVVEAGAFDAQGLAAVELRIDGFLADVRTEEPFTFAYDTLDLSNGGHVFQALARDRAGNEAQRSLMATVINKEIAPPPPCSPACNLGSGSTAGDLPPITLDSRARVIPLAEGGHLEISESFRVPWRPSVVRTPTGVHLVLDVVRPKTLTEADGFVGSDLSPSEMVGIRSWDVIVRNYGGEPGSVRDVSILLAFRTSPAAYDTDQDGLSDSADRSLGTVPVLPDTDGDLRIDGDEIASRSVRFVIDGVPVERAIRTDPLDYDTDDDGLPDGPELYPVDGANSTDPLEADTDRDGLGDGAERLTYGSDPTLTDSDGDTLSDFQEVTPQEFRAEIDGVEVERTLVTSPVATDTDEDGLRDDEEWDGISGYGFLTDPTDPDTDRDGLSDHDEVVGLNRNPTNPLLSDTEGDGLIDGLDLSPTELWSPAWKTAFEPGLVRFTQRFHAIGVHGVSATIWTYNVADDSCVFLSDHTADATRSSNESIENVVATINQVLVAGGETNFTATAAEDLGEESSGTATSVYGGCTFDSARQYRFVYLHDSRASDIDFVNTAGVPIRDDAGDLFYQATMAIPVRLSKPQAIVLQMALQPDADLGSETEEGVTIVPAILYSLYTGTDFLASPPFYRNLAVGATIDNHSYEFQMRIPKEVASAENVDQQDGVPIATLFMMPMWLTSRPSGVTRSPLNVTHGVVGAMIARVEETADLVVARLSTDMKALEAALPAWGDSLSTGYQTFGNFSVYVYRVGDVFDSASPERVDAIYVVGESPEEVATFRDSIVWSPAGVWVRKSEDDFGLAINVLKILRRGVSLTSQVTAEILLPVVNAPAGREEMTFGRSVFVVNKLTNIETGEPYYVISATTMQTVKFRVNARLTDVTEVPVQSVAEIVDDLDDSKLLTGVKYASLRSALRGAAVGVTLAIFGTQAVLAFQDGDIVKGTVYVLAGATATFGVVKSDAVLIERLLGRRAEGVGLKVRFGSVATIAVTGILASFEIYQAGQTADPVKRLSHYESAGAIVVDSLVTAVPLYGAAAMLGWQLGLTIAVGVGAIVGALPDPLALRIVSTPGSTITFFFEYTFTTEIPSDIAEDALTQLLNFLVDSVRRSNALDPPNPTLLLVP